MHRPLLPGHPIITMNPGTCTRVSRRSTVLVLSILLHQAPRPPAPPPPRPQRPQRPQRPHHPSSQPTATDWLTDWLTQWVFCRKIYIWSAIRTNPLYHHKTQSPAHSPRLLLFTEKQALTSLLCEIPHLFFSLMVYQKCTTSLQNPLALSLPNCCLKDVLLFSNVHHLWRWTFSLLFYTSFFLDLRFLSLEPVLQTPSPPSITLRKDTKPHTHTHNLFRIHHMDCTTFFKTFL